MNFRTTLILLVIGAAVGIGLLVAKYWPSSEAQPTVLVELKGDEAINRLTVRPASGTAVVLEKSGDRWRIAEPIATTADASAVNALLDALRDSKLRAGEGTSDLKPADVGLDKPRYVVEAQTASGPKPAVNVGAKAAVGDILYVRIGSGKRIYTAPATVLSALERKADLLSAFRDTQLLPDAGNLDVREIKIARKDATIALKKDGATWKTLEPDPAMPVEVEKLSETVINTLRGLRAREFVDEGSAEAKSAGLGTPAATITVGLAGPSGQETATLLLGGYDNPTVKGSVYAAVAADHVLAKVSASDAEKLLKLKALDLRRRRLVATEDSNLEVQSLNISRGNVAINLEKSGGKWKMLSPKADMPLEEWEVTSIADAVKRIEASEFIDDAAADAAKADIAHPVVTILARLGAPGTTQPAVASTQPAGITVVLGQYAGDDKQKVFAAVPGVKGIGKVSAEELEKLLKVEPLDLRNREVVKIDPANVHKITLVSDQPATTQPTSRPAKHTEVAIQRKPAKPAGPELPTTMPAGPTTRPSVTIAAPTTRPSVATTAPTTGPAVAAAATTQPSTQPVASTQPVLPPSDWDLLSSPGADADQSEVTSLLKEFNPLRVNKYLSEGPTTRPVPSGDRYTLTINTIAPGGAKNETHQIVLVDPGESKPIVGEYGPFRFELSSWFLENLKKDFKNKLPPPPPPSMPSFDPGGGMP